VALGGAPAVAAELDAAALVAELAALGPRAVGSEGHLRAQDLLLERMREVGLERVSRSPAAAGKTNLEGWLPGSGEGEIVLAAHYDTVAGSPGAVDDASGCAVVLAAAADLSRTPRRRAVRVVLFDGEEQGLRGSRQWARGLEAREREEVLGAVVVEMVGSREQGRGAALDLGAVGDAGRRTPAWLLHAALRAGDAVSLPLTAASPTAALAMQLVARTSSAPYGADHEALLAEGVPAITLSDFEILRPYDAHHEGSDVVSRVSGPRLEHWTSLVAALTRRMDGLAGRPHWENEYLAAAGRVWIRRDLIWLGLLSWGAMVMVGRPGRWVRADAETRRRRGRRYLPGYLFRAAFLLVTLWFPAVGGPLIFPLAPLALAGGRGAPRAIVRGLGAAPTLVWLLLLVVGRARGFVDTFELEVAKLALLGACLAGFWWQSELGGATAGSRPGEASAGG
jgi:hypothetical protein